MTNNSTVKQAKKERKKRYKSLFIIIGIIYVLFVYISIHYAFVASYSSGDFLDTLTLALKHAVTQPFDLSPFPFSVFKFILLVTFILAAIFFFVYWEQKMRRHDDLDTIAGDAKWMTDEELAEYNKTHTEPFGEPVSKGYNNAIISNDMFLSMNASKTQRNLNMFVIGGSGVGKSFRFVGPNILQRNCSMVVTDPSGGLYKSYGPYLEYYGYRVKCFNLDHMDKSNHYNPFNYIYSDKDIEVLVTMLIENTTSPMAKGGDDFWTKCEIALLCALIAYLFHYRPKHEQNFSTVKNLIRVADIDENDSSSQSRLDLLFEELRKVHPQCFAMTQYDTFRLGAGKTLKSILISCAVRLQAFDLDDVRTLTDSDDIELDKISDEPTAIFIIIPTGEKTFNFLGGLMYSQLFSRLYRYCENTSEFGYVLQDSDGNIVKTFRAETLKDSENARLRGEEFLKLCQNAQVINNPKLLMEDNGGSKREFWEIRSGKQLISYRGDKKLAMSALEAIKNGKIVPVAKLGNHGQRCPIHVRFLLDEFANTGKIPDFPEKISTIRKYEISTTIILQSLKQIVNLYEKEWDIITSNCDTTVYLGGGNDTQTTEWINKLLGKKTVIGTSMSLSSNGGSDSFQRSGIDLASLSQLRTMPNQECIVLARSENAFMGKMYDTPHHSEWDLLQSLPSYEFSETRHVYISQQTEFATEETVESNDTIKPDSKNDEEYKKAVNDKETQTSFEVIQGENLLGEKMISEITIIDPLDVSADTSEKVDETIGSVTSAAATSSSAKASKEEIQGMLSFNFDGDMSFSGAPMGD